MFDHSRLDQENKFFPFKITQPPTTLILKGQFIVSPTTLLERLWIVVLHTYSKNSLRLIRPTT